MLAIMTILTIQAVLSAQLLEICLMLFANLSIAFLIDSVIPQPRKVESSLGLILGVLSSLSYFAVAFPCGQIAERPIPPRRCRSSGPLVDSIVLNLTIDLLLVSWLFPTLAEKRLTAMVLFGSRATVSLITSGLVDRIDSVGVVCEQDFSHCGGKREKTQEHQAAAKFVSALHTREVI